MNNKIQIGSAVKHVDGTIGHVIAVYENGEHGRLVEWKSVKEHRTSPERALTAIDRNEFRWRKS